MEQQRRSHQHDRTSSHRKRPEDEDLRHEHGKVSASRPSRDHETRPKVGLQHQRAVRDIARGDFATPLSADDNYVRRWLLQTSHDDAKEREIVRESSRYDEQQAKHSNLIRSFGRLQENVEPPKKKIRRHHTSSDSSLITVPKRRTEPVLSVESNTRREKLKHHQGTMHTGKRQRVDSSESGLSFPSEISSSHQHETFEKRARHKTREDRYDHKKRKNTEAVESEKKISKSKREKRGDRKKASKQKGEALVRNFSSQNVAQDRLTIRPTSGLGLFGNGRASSPAKRRGVPDLAFSEMDFLQRSNRQQSTEKDERIKSKYREKEKRRKVQTYEEISAFFKTKKTPLQDISYNVGRRESTAAIRDESIAYKRPYHAPNASTRYQTSDTPENSHLFSGPRERSLDPIPTNHACSGVASYTRETPRSKGENPESSTSYVTWSESHRRGSLDRNSHPSPETIRRLLESTGILRDTGIVFGSEFLRSSPSRFAQSDSPRKVLPAEPEKEYRNLTAKTATTDATLSTEELLRDRRFRVANRGRETTPRQHERVSSGQLRAIRQAPTLSFCAQPNESQELPNPGPRITLTRFNPHGDWDDEDSPKSPGQKALAIALAKVSSQEYRSSPINRALIAKDARIKRPSTTVPVIEPREEVQMAIVESRSAVKDGVQNNANKIPVSPEMPTKCRAKASQSQNKEASVNTDHNDQASHQSVNDNTAHTITPSMMSRGPDSSAGENHASIATALPERVAPSNQQKPPNFESKDISVKDNNKSFLGLPVRGGGRIDHFTMPARPVRISFATGMESMEEATRSGFHDNKLEVSLANSEYQEQQRDTRGGLILPANLCNDVGATALSDDASFGFDRNRPLQTIYEEVHDRYLPALDEPGPWEPPFQNQNPEFYEDDQVQKARWRQELPDYPRKTYLDHQHDQVWQKPGRSVYSQDGLRQSNQFSGVGLEMYQPPNLEQPNSHGQVFEETPLYYQQVDITAVDIFTTTKSNFFKTRISPKLKQVPDYFTLSAGHILKM